MQNDSRCKTCNGDAIHSVELCKECTNKYVQLLDWVNKVDNFFSMITISPEFKMESYALKSRCRSYQHQLDEILVRNREAKK